MNEARSARGRSSVVTDGPRARAHRGQYRDGRRTLLLTLFFGCMAVGIGCIGWALINIGAQAQAVASSDAYLGPTSSLTAVSVDQSSSTVPVAAPKESGVPSGTTRTPRTVVYAKNPAEGDALGSLSIPALGQKLPIIEGTGTSALKKGVGHYTKSVLPGQMDNCVLSAHRDTFFARLGELKKGDRVNVQTAVGTYEYKITRTRIVGKNDRTIIVPTDHGVLTLTTCYPFDYVGSAPKRYIVSADLVTSK